MNHLESSFAGKNAFWRYFVMLLVILAATNTIGAIPLFISMAISSASDPQVFSQLAANPNDLSPLGLDPNMGLAIMIFPFIIGLLAFILLVKPLNGRSIGKVINGTDSFRWNRFLVAALVWTVVSAFYLIINLKLDPTNFSVNNKTLSLITLSLISILFIPFQAAFEEVIFRGYLMQGFAVILKNRFFPLVLTSVLFGLMHAFNPEVKEFGFWTMIPQYVLFGIIFGVITILDDGIEAAMGAHAANNIFLCIMVTNESSALQTQAVFEQHVVYPWTELLTMFIMGVLIIFILKWIFKWKDLSLLFTRTENPSAVNNHTP
jgi:membrane protease YdiL (CAAX protease family)